MNQKQALAEALDEIQKELTEIQNLKALITELCDALEIYGTMYPGTPLKELLQRAREATR